MLFKSSLRWCIVCHTTKMNDNYMQNVCVCVYLTDRMDYYSIFIYCQASRLNVCDCIILAPF